MRFRLRHDARGFQATAPKMVRRSLTPRLGLGVIPTLSLCLGTMLCGGALFVAPLRADVVAGADENGPKVQILSPNFNDVIKGKFDIKIAIAAGNYNPATIEMFVNDASATGGAIPLRNLGASFGWDTRQFIDGPHKLTVRVTDTQGFRGWAEVNVFINNNRIVDDLAPSLSWRNVRKDMMLSGKAQIQLDANDFFGVKLVKITVTSARNPDEKQALATWLLNKPPYVINFDTTRVPDGTYYLRANAWDSSEQQGIAPALRFGVLNNAINAQSLNEQLAGFQALEQAIAQQEKPKVSVPLPVLGDDPRVADVRPVRKIEPRALADHSTADDPTNTQDALRATPAVSKLSPLTVPQTKTKAQTRGAQVKNDQTLAPKPMVVAALKPATKASTPILLSGVQLPELTASRDSIAPPRLKIARAQKFQARTSAPQLAAREIQLPNTATLSAGQSPRLAFAGAVQTTTTPQVVRENPTRVAVPAAQPRAFIGKEATLSAAGISSSRAASAALAAPAARPQTTRLTPPQLSGASAPSAVNADSEPVRATLTRLKPNSLQTSPALSASKTAITSSPVQTRIAKVPTMPQVAALPRADRPGRLQGSPAITVSPITATVSDAPTSHRVTRSTALRTIAARYGLPVELVAACNGWPIEKVVTSGVVVELPRPLQVAFGGKTLPDSSAMLVGGTGVTAFRFLFEQAGGTITWDAKSKRVIARKGESEIQLSIGSKVAQIGDEKVMMELAAFLFEGRTMVPVRLFEEGLRAQVEWDPQTGRMVVAMLADASDQG